MFPIFRCIQFLISWQDAGGSAGVAAASFMRKYSGVLLRLCSNQAVIHRIDSVKTLMSTVTLHGGQGDSGDGVIKDGQVKLSKFTNIHDSLDHDAGRLLAELTASADSSDRLIAVLNDIQSFSNPKPGILIHFQEELMYHMSHSNNSVRTITYNLILKHLKQRPDSWRTILQGNVFKTNSRNTLIAS